MLPPWCSALSFCRQMLCSLRGGSHGKLLALSVKRRTLIPAVSSCSTGRRFLTINVITSSSSATPERLIDECLKVRSSVQQLNDKFRGPLEKSAQKNTLLPFVFLLGNHSSGKSSFVNYVCQRKVQTAGVAPTDDCFTLIIPGAADADRDGPALVGDPDMGFSGLRVFGPQLIHHTQLKVRCDIAIKNFCIVDTPGMIDSPFSPTGKGSVADRGYDFEGIFLLPLHYYIFA